MAKLYPNKLSGSVSPEVVRVYRQLKKLPDTFSVWYNLTDKDAAPQFLVVWESRCAYLLYITSTDQELVETAIHGDLFGSSDTMTPERLGREVQEVLTTFTQNLPSPESFPIQPIVVFPNVSKGSIDTIAPMCNQDGEIHYLGKQQFSAEKLAAYFTEHAPAEISNPQLIQLRHQFTPEVTVPDHFSPLRVNRSGSGGSIAPQLLDLDQEWCMKNNLYLPEEAEKIIQPNPTPIDLPEESVDSAEDTSDSDETTDTIFSQLVTGVAGSGKSLILLYRALLNARLNPNARVLILTHNRPINNELQSRFEHLSGGKINIKWFTFFAWARQQLDSSEWPQEKSGKERFISPGDALKVIAEILKSRPNNKFTPDFIADEIGFLKDHYVSRLDDYLTLSRTGQNRGLIESQRREVWQIFKSYQEYLHSNQLTDWHNIAIRFHQKAMANKCRFPAYHCILIDEAQFFAKSWFEIVKKALIPGGQLFLSADPTQGFLKRRQSWISSGIEVRGRTTRLKKAYRNSREILYFATQFFYQRQLHSEMGAKAKEEADGAGDSEELNLLTDQQIQDAPSLGTKPIIIATNNHQDAHARLLRELKELAIQQGRKSGDTTHPSILILHADSKQLGSLQRSLQYQIPNLTFHDLKTGPAPAHSFAQLTTLNAATGLEASIVFLLGIDSLLGQEGSPTLSPDEREDLMARNTRLLYMGFTRAAQKLVIFSTLVKKQ